MRDFVLNHGRRKRKRIRIQEQRKVRAKRMARVHGGVSYVAWGDGDGVVVRALERVEDALPNKAMDAPIGIVVVEIRRLVRLGGEGVDCTRLFASLCRLVGIGSLVGSLAAWRLLQRDSSFVVSDTLWSCLTMSSIESASGG